MGRPKSDENLAERPLLSIPPSEDLPSPPVCSRAGLDKFWLAILFGSSVLIAAGNQVLFKKLLTAYSSQLSSKNYSWWANEWTVLLYLVLAFLVLAYKLRFTKDIPQSMRDQSSVAVFCVMGFLDASAGLLGAVGGVYTPGSIQTLLNQVVIVITVVFGIFYLKERYDRMQYLGCFFILAGAVVSCIPSFLGHKSGDGSQEHSKLLSIAVFFLGLIPSSFSNVYKEKKMKVDSDPDVFYLSCWVTTFQCAFGVLFVPILAIPGLGGVPFQKLPEQITGGMECFVGKVPEAGFESCKSDALLITLLYVVVNFGYNAVLLLLTKRGSALLLVISCALALPVTNVAFSLHAIMGDQVEPFSVYTAVGLAVVIFGFLVYARLGLKKEDHIVTTSGPPGQMVYTVYDTRPRAASFSGDIQDSYAPPSSAPRPIARPRGLTTDCTTPLVAETI